MSGRDWKLGDVARLEADRDLEVTAIWQGNQWATEHGRYLADWQVNARPVVVIDPEDREQVEWLLSAMPWTNRTASQLQKNLRKLLGPERPPEPGTWGVVEASCVHHPERRKWVRHDDGNWWEAGLYQSGGLSEAQACALARPDDWDSLVDPVVIREGVAA